jgi:spore photoproduct lyase
MKYRISKIIKEEGTEQFSQTSAIISRLYNLPVITCNNTEEYTKSDIYYMDKETLRLISFKGEFLKPCPGTNNYICCGYNILNIGTNCPLDCSYCILQAYFNKPSLRIFVNLENELGKIGEIIDNHPEKIFRIGTGEFTDSLALDEIHRYSNIISEFIKYRKNVIIEYKTKTIEIKRLLDISIRERILVSWSLNSPYIVAHEEHGAPSIKQRLIAAKACQDEGFIIGFHFDPLIKHENWKEQYLKTIELIAKYLQPDKILWVSMGCLRFLPSLKQIILKRHPESILLDSEFIHGLDGKSRYLKPVRIEMYSYMANLLKKWAGQDIGLYLCMESDEVWRKSLGWSPGNSQGLSNYLDSRVKLLW